MDLTKNKMTQEALDKLATARAALDGQSPRARGAEKQRAALDWIYRWGWSSAKILDAATGGGRAGISARLVKNKFLRATKTETGGSVKGIPIHILTLTPLGLDEAERHREDLIQFELDPYRIDQSKLRHDSLAQMSTANGMNEKRIIGYKTPKELAAKSNKDIKQPDVLWITADDQRIGVEIELSAKWDRKLDQFVLSCLFSMSKDANPVNKVNTILLVSDSKAIIKRYSKAFLKGQSFGVWNRNDRGFWTQTAVKTIPDWIDGKVICQHINY